MAAQKDGGGGDISKSKSHLAFRTDTLLSNDNLIHRWITEKPDATLGRRPETASTTVGIQGNMSVVQYMSGIIATEGGRGRGVAMQNAAKSVSWGNECDIPHENVAPFQNVKNTKLRSPTTDHQG